jgi:predicted dehydrogenase
MGGIDRREFMQGAGAALCLGSTRLGGPRRGSREELSVAVVGLNGRGRDHLRAFRSMEGVRVAALCDVDRDVLERERVNFGEGGVDVAVDLRTLLARDDIDAISIATPNHWHALQTAWACAAGKDVYVEKPVSHDVAEGRRLVELVERTGRIVQCGTQSRSSAALREMIAWVRAGHLGRIELARGLCYKPRQSIGRVDGPLALSTAIDYELWTGPAPKGPLRRKRLHYDWHWQLATGNGDLGNQGIHQMDIARWALGEEELPRSVWSVGGRVGYEDDGDTPNTHIVWLDYESAPLVFEVRGLPRDAAAQAEGWGRSMDAYRGASIGVILHCERGWVRVPNYESAVAFDDEGQEVARWEGADDHYANFVEAVRARDAALLNAPIREGHVSSACCHLGLASHLAGERAAAADIATAVEGTPLEEAFERMRRHLTANGVDVEGPALTLGRRLVLDADARAGRGPGLLLDPQPIVLSREPRAHYAFPDLD